MAITLVMALLLAGCGAPGFESPALGTETSQGPITTASDPASSDATGPGASSMIGEPADDGARTIQIVTIDRRTRDLTVETTSVGTQRVRLLLPTAYDEQPDRRWPVLFLLHGADNVGYRDWTRWTDVAALTEPTDLLVVMPDAGGYGYYSDWWNHGDGGPPMWETFHTIELVQLIERNWRTSDRRAVAGLSMGGLGAMDYTARHPGLFVAAASYSGVLDNRQSGSPATNLWGELPAQADVWAAHNPYELAPGLRGAEFYVSYGNGKPGPLDPAGAPSSQIEALLEKEGAAFVDRLRDLDIPVTVDAYGDGTHTWPYWERALHRSFPMLLDALDEAS